MENSMGSLKLLYDVKLKATSNREINGRSYEEGEVIVSFDEVQIGSIKEIIDYFSANGGWHNQPHIIWKTPKSVPISFSNGVFSPEQLSFMVNARLISRGENNPITITATEDLEAREDGTLELKEIPTKAFFYLKKTGEKIVLQKTGDKSYAGADPYSEIRAVYEYEYTRAAKTLMLGADIFRLPVALEAKTRIKDDTDGRIRTGIFKIPKLTIVSSLSFTLGEKASPVVAQFNGIGYPVGPRGNETTMELNILDDNLDSDI